MHSDGLKIRKSQPFLQSSPEDEIYHRTDTFQQVPISPLQHQEGRWCIFTLKHPRWDANSCLVLLEESSEKQLLKAPCWWLKAIFDILQLAFFSKTKRLACWLTHLHNLKSFSSSLPTWRNSTRSPFEDLQLFIWNIFAWYSETWISLKGPRNSPILNYENPKALRHVSWGLKFCALHMKDLLGFSCLRPKQIHFGWEH